MKNLNCLNCRFFIFFFLFALRVIGQDQDTLNGYASTVFGEEINYFSPMHQFAPRALLTRANGQSEISWEAPVYNGKKQKVCYELLIGHSTGTSSGQRIFDVKLNGNYLFGFVTEKHQKGNFIAKGDGLLCTSFYFKNQEFDLNYDAFGKLYISVPSSFVKDSAVFTFSGKNLESRDWLMVFMYAKELKISIQPSNLVLRKSNKRQVNIFIDNPYKGITPFEFIFGKNVFHFSLLEGYNKLSIAAYDTSLVGPQQVLCMVNNTLKITEKIYLKPIHSYSFQLIHHSHNDIGYSHLQTEVEQIQNRNISSAIRWIEQNKNAQEKPYWHIESLWAVENFLRIASVSEKELFVRHVKSGQIVLSANYANILTGLGREEELSWALEYAHYLEKTYGFVIHNVMTTDIPGLSYAGFKSYTNAKIPYLSFGPNYIGSLPDRGDRVGSLLREQGDKAFYWKPDSASKQQILVWTAGKGYSYFHGIPESTKQADWEQRISDYCEELLAQNYPYDLVQLRYTKISDNGPVDTTLCAFIENWNAQYSSPQIHITSLNNLFGQFEKRYKNQLPSYTGEIAPYWEDGAYSTAVEEIKMRYLVEKTLQMEAEANRYKTKVKYANDFYLLHKNIVLFHEHTWGSWCSISDPEIAFTTKQWEIKKSFLDSAQFYFKKIVLEMGISLSEEIADNSGHLHKVDFEIDSVHGGIKYLWVDGENRVNKKADYALFEPIYSLGINPMQKHFMQVDSVRTEMDNAVFKCVIVKGKLPSMPAITLVYLLDKTNAQISCTYRFDKAVEKGKESLHLAMPIGDGTAKLSYGTEQKMMEYPGSLLDGSNKEFVCVPNQVLLEGANGKYLIKSPGLALLEVGGIIDENKTNGAKAWKTAAQKTDIVFWYVFNNYWHTNYKAYQEGQFEFTVDLFIEE